MFEGNVFTLVAVAGNFLDAWDPGTDALRYDGLTWDEAVELARLSFMQNYEVVIWKMPEGGEDEPKETAVSEETV